MCPDADGLQYMKLYNTSQHIRLPEEDIITWSLWDVTEPPNQYWDFKKWIYLKKKLNQYIYI